MKYTTILADPPWPYHSPQALVGNRSRGAVGADKIKQVNIANHYDTMPVEEIKALPIKALTTDNAHLYLWTTNSFMVEAHEVAHAWGFVPKTIITWVKMKDDGTPSMKTGYWYRSATEHAIFAVKGKLRLNGTAAPTAFLHPRLPHSVKPDFFYTIIESHSPGPYLELFARRNRNSWDAWGNQVSNSVEI